MQRVHRWSFCVRGSCESGQCLVFMRSSFVWWWCVAGVPLVSEIWIYGPHLGNGREIWKLWMGGGIWISGVGTLKHIRTSVVVQGVLIRVFGDCVCDVRPAGRRRLLVRRMQVGLALWGDGAPEGAQWRLVAHSLGRGLRPKRSECRNSGSTMCQT